MKKEILIHCGVTMIKPITEIAKIIEKQENCIIKITTGGSGNLYKSIKANKIGDLYLPGSEAYIEKGTKDKFITEKTFVGENKIALMVQKGNPKNIEPSLNCLLNENYRIVIGNPNRGSIGKKTKKILDKIGIFDKIKNRTEYLPTDSRGLIEALKNDKADIVINWYATSTWGENKDFVEVLDIESEFIIEEKLYIGLILYSQHPEIAKKFMEFASSEKGKEIFKKYGLYYAK
ncbi:MAG: molybdate ABC transporter substrate-binding protein [Bacteroidota bacterium]